MSVLEVHFADCNLKSFGKKSSDSEIIQSSSEITFHE